MTELKFYLLCFMIAAPQGALGSAAQSHSGAPMPRDDSPWRWGVQYNISLPPDSEFVAKLVVKSDWDRNRDYTDLFWTESPEECLEKAISGGFHAFRIYRTSCRYYRVHTPICNKWEGDYPIYIRKDKLSDGSPSDNATFDVESAQQFLPEGVLRYYRIESPTILKFGNLIRGVTSPTEMLQYFAVYVGDEMMYSDSLILADPSCYTTSTCSNIFLTIAPEIPASDLFILHDICGQSIPLDSGKSIYVLSHEGLGCKNFPNDYPEADCWAEFTGAGEITLNVTLVNFRESDQCDGFTMTAVTDDASGSSTSTDLCDATAPTELTSAGGKVKIEFGGSASPTREKYGFDIRVTAA